MDEEPHKPEWQQFKTTIVESWSLIQCEYFLSRCPSAQELDSSSRRFKSHLSSMSPGRSKVKWTVIPIRLNVVREYVRIILLGLVC